MSRRVAPLLAFGAAVAAAACVEIATGPGGAASIRLLPVAPAIIAGDSLRDSTGAIVRLRAVAFNDRGDSVSDAGFRFTALPLSTDTTAAGRALAVAVDSITGAVRALGPTPVHPRARLAVRLGERLQVIDTITVVKRPTRLGRAPQNGDSVTRFAFLCSDSGRASTQVATRELGPGDTVRLTNAAPIAVRLTADSTADTLRAPVPSYFVRFEILSPTTIPTVTASNGTRRPAISIVTDPTTDRTTNTDTTDAQGVATAFVRVIASGLPPTGAFADSVFDVTVRASARTSPTAIVPSPIQFVVRLRRLARLGPNAELLTGPGCGR